MSETIHYERKGHVARLVLDNPSRHNALGRSELEGICAALDQVTADDQVRVLVLTGAGEKTVAAARTQAVSAMIVCARSGSRMEAPP